MNKSADIEIMASGKYFRMLNKAGWEYIEPNCFTGVVLIVPITDDGKLVLIEQYRTPVDSVVVELPAGLVGDEPDHGVETMQQAANRELIEETGFSAAELEIINEGAPSPGSNSVILTFVKATKLTKVGPGGGVSSEDIKVFEVPLNEVHQFLADRQAEGKIIDLKVYAGLCMIGKGLV